MVQVLWGQEVEEEGGWVLLRRALECLLSGL
jgi:hypothetical protein